MSWRRWKGCGGGSSSVVYLGLSEMSEMRMKGFA